MIRSDKLLFAFVLVAVIVVFAGSAHAGIILIPGPGNIAGDENILFNKPGLTLSGTTVQGLTNSTDLIVNFTSGDALLASSAKIEGPFNSLSIELHDLTASFTSLMFNLNAAKNGSVSITIDSFSWPDLLLLDKNGQNFFRIIATGGDRINQVSFVSTVGIDDIGQVRIGGAGIPVTTTSTGGGDFVPEQVPEPGSMLLLGSGLAVFGLLGRWRRRA